MSNEETHELKLPLLEEPCGCNYGYDRMGDKCSRCHGTQLRPTEAGERILQLVMRHVQAIEGSEKEINARTI